MYKYIYYNLYSNDFLSHHGVQGMHWGVRRYQNPDGTLTSQGREHLQIKEAKGKKYSKKDAKLLRSDIDKKFNKELNTNKELDKAKKLLTDAEEKESKAIDKYEKYLESENAKDSDKIAQALMKSVEEAVDESDNAYINYSNIRKNIIKTLQSEYTPKQMEAMRKKGGDYLIKLTGILNEY